MFDTSKYVIEYRFSGGRYGGAWLVLKDKQTGEYYREKPGAKAYARFNNSDEVMEFIANGHKFDESHFKF